MSVRRPGPTSSKGFAEEIAPILAEIFRQSLRDGVIPSVWKNADVAPVFKEGAGTSWRRHQDYHLLDQRSVVPAARGYRQGRI